MDVCDMPGTTLTRYSYTQTTTLPQGCSSITVLFNTRNPIELKTPDNREIYIKTGSTDYIYIHGSGDSYFEYQETGAGGVSNSVNVNWVNAHSNEVSERQIVLDTRLATNDIISLNDQTCPE
ncbi:MAG: hypothetical protein QXH42_09770 [Thermoplasmata archaeon]